MLVARCHLSQNDSFSTSSAHAASPSSRCHGSTPSGTSLFAMRAPTVSSLDHHLDRDIPGRTDEWVVIDFETASSRGTPCQVAALRYRDGVELEGFTSLIHQPPTRSTRSTLPFTA
jgi:hypothetical protein